MKFRPNSQTNEFYDLDMKPIKELKLEQTSPFLFVSPIRSTEPESRLKFERNADGFPYKPAQVFTQTPWTTAWKSHIQLRESYSQVR